MVFVSHRLAEVLEISSRVTVLRDGKLVGVYPTAGMTQSRLTELMTGKTFDQSDQRQRSHADSPVVLTGRRADARTANYDDVSLTIRKRRDARTDRSARCRANRAGAVDLRHAPARQRHHLDRRRGPVDLRSNRDAIRAGIGYLSEDRLSLGLIQPQSIADNTGAAGARQDPRSRADLATAGRTQLVGHWIDDLAIKIGWQTDPISTLSGGNQQRVAIAKWLAVGLKLLILDSPTVGVDVGARAGIFEIVAKARAREGLAILLISDEVPEVYFNADRVLHMAEGRIVARIRSRGISASTALEAAVYA